MLRVLTQSQAQILNILSNKYLKSEDITNDSIEVETITELAVVYWHYTAGNDQGKKITMPWFEFAISILTPAMFKSQPFKFNGIVSKCIMNHEKDLMEEFMNFDQEVEAKEARKKEDQKNKEKVEKKSKA